MLYNDQDGGGSYFCNHCGAGDGFSSVGKVLRIDSRIFRQDRS
ncbi:MAG: hypothetical protein HQL51_05140 [Magnetococcales bacterium]|nr:hypothetical protein [Magnetococcales bacterium]